MEKIDLTIKILGSIGTIAAILFAVYQFTKGQRWQKAKLLLDLIDEFESNEKIRAAKEMLDWDKRVIEFGEKKKLNFTNEKLISALKVVEWDDDQFSIDEKLIRDSFDAFFDFFHKLYSFQKSKLLIFKDFAYFYYYFELLRDVETYKGDIKYKTLFREYIENYYFIGIESLLKEYSKKPQPLKIMGDEE